MKRREFSLEMAEPSTHRPFFTVIEDGDGVHVTIEVSEEDYQADLAAGIV